MCKITNRTTYSEALEVPVFICVCNWCMWPNVSNEVVSGSDALLGKYDSLEAHGSLRNSYGMQMENRLSQLWLDQKFCGKKIMMRAEEWNRMIAGDAPDCYNTFLEDYR